MFRFFWARSASVWLAVLYMIIGIFLALFPGLSGIIFVRIIAAVSLIFAVINLYRYIKNRMDMLQDGVHLFAGVLFLIFSLFCFIKPEIVLSILPFILGVLLIIDGTGKLPIAIEAIRMRKNTLMPVFPLVLSSLIPLAFGILLVVNPFTVSSIIIMIFGISLIADGISDLATAIITKRNHNDD